VRTGQLFGRWVRKREAEEIQVPAIYTIFGKPHGPQKLHLKDAEATKKYSKLVKARFGVAY
jgi:hypothetical protein